MKAIAIEPGRAGSLHARDVPHPELDDLPDGRGARVRMIRVGLCGTDADLAAGAYGVAPVGDDHLVLGHESLGRVVELGPAAAEPAVVGPAAAGPAAAGPTVAGPAVAAPVAVGQLVVPTIRRPGTSAYDRIGRPDLSTDPTFIETGISRAHGFMTEEVVVDADYLVPVPDELEPVAVLTEPLSCITKSLRQAEQVEARLGRWEPARALVTGASTIGLLATLALRLRGLNVTTVGRRPPGYRDATLIEGIGGRYVSAPEGDLMAVAGAVGGFDIVFEGSGDARLLEPAVAALAPNGVLALFSVTPGHRRVPVDVAALNQSVVLYNRVIVGSAAAAWGDYAAAVETIAAAERDPATRGWLGELITDRIDGLDAEAIAAHLAGAGDGIKTTVELRVG